MPAPREVLMFRNYFLDWYRTQTDDVRKKVRFVLKILREMDIVSAKYLKHIRGEIYEMRAGFGTNIFRVFCCFDEGNIIVLFHGFQKKTNETPSHEIEKALRIHREYQQAKAEGKIADFLGTAP
jgi:phage-related protein